MDHLAATFRICIHNDYIIQAYVMKLAHDKLYH